MYYSIKNSRCRILIKIIDDDRGAVLKSISADGRNEALRKEVPPKYTVLAARLYTGIIQKMYDTVTSVWRIFVEHYLASET